MKDILELIRGLVRPTVTWGTVAAIIAMLMLSVPIPEWFQVMASVIIGFWFGQRENKDGNSDA
jgi:hypothetical protein